MPTTGTTTEVVDTRSQTEYNNMCNRKSNAESDASETEEKIAQYQDYVDRLKEAYDSIYYVKTALETHWKERVKKSYEEYNDDGYAWKGSTYNMVVKEVDEYIEWHYEDVIENIDEILDEVNTKRSTYQNIIYILEDKLAGLKILINSLWTDITNYWN